MINLTDIQYILYNNSLYIEKKQTNKHWGDFDTSLPRVELDPKKSL